MSDGISLSDALAAQAALRDAAGLGAETFPIQAFVGMISDEVEVLRKQGRSDDDIAKLIAANSSIKISANDIGENYAPPEERNHS
ncbi:MAG: hypothetical protein M3N19_07405 [Candidatus Eremiobacteraeota bacterium]|nr:hypothetical protein [Candidatus Eremiobacteraeota bacterium]